MKVLVNKGFFCYMQLLWLLFYARLLFVNHILKNKFDVSCEI